MYLLKEDNKSLKQIIEENVAIALEVLLDENDQEIIDECSIEEEEEEAEVEHKDFKTENDFHKETVEIRYQNITLIELLEK